MFKLFIYSFYNFVEDLLDIWILDVSIKRKYFVFLRYADLSQQKVSLKCLNPISHRVLYGFNYLSVNTFSHLFHTCHLNPFTAIIHTILLDISWIIHKIYLLCFIVLFTLLIQL